MADDDALYNDGERVRLKASTAGSWRSAALNKAAETRRPGRVVRSWGGGDRGAAYVVVEFDPLRKGTRPLEEKVAADSVEAVPVEDEFAAARDRELEQQAAASVPAPPSGSYTGTVDGCHAIFAVTYDTVSAWWVRPSLRGELLPRQDAWDITDGRFVPHDGTARGFLAVRISKASRRHAPGDGD